MDARITDPQSAIRNPQSDIAHAYTDAPELHPNLILGSLQLLFWLFFHPSAWRNHVARIDPNLHPDFCLAELSGAQWRSPALRRVLIQGHVVLPLLVGSFVGVTFWVLGKPSALVANSLARGIADNVAGGLVCSIAIAVGGGVALGAAVGAAIGLEMGMTGSLPIGVALAVAIFVMARLGMSMTGWRPARSLARQVGGVVMGVLMGSAVLLMAYAVVGTTMVSVAGKTLDDANRVQPWGVASCVALGAAVGLRTRSWRRGLVFGAVLCVIFGIGYSLQYGMSSRTEVGTALPWVYRMANWVLALRQKAQPVNTVLHLVYGMAEGIMFGSFAALPWVLTKRIAGPWAGAIAASLVGGGWGAVVLVVKGVSPQLTLLFFLIGILLVLTTAWWQPVVLYPFLEAWNTVLYYAEGRRTLGRPSLLRWHSAFWDEFQRLPLFGLDEHLVLVMERSPAEGQAALAYVATGYQRWAAQAAQIELDARGLERCRGVEAICQAHRSLAIGELEGPASALLRSFSRLSQDVDAALYQESAYNQRLALSAVEDRLDGLMRELTRSSERYAIRFRPVADLWRQVVTEYIHKLAQAAEARQEIDNPYVIGVPLSEQQEIFVGRTDISAQIEHLLLDRRRPPLLLYGQRRLGKTSLLNNLGRLLPSTIVPLFVDLQGPVAWASDHAGLLYNLARGIVESARQQRNLVVPSLPRETLASDPFTCFDEWLDQVERALGQDTALLALDEFEALESAFAKRHLDEEAVLGMLRHVIQHRPRFKVLLAGSHTLEELQRWAGYLINVQVVHIGYLKEDEARQLIERPVKDFPLRYEPDARQRVLALTRGHPFLVQLLCAEIVALKNEQPPAVRRLARLADVEAAIPRAMSHGSFFFVDIQQNQVDAAGLTLLRFLAAQGEGATVSRQHLARQCPGDLDITLDLLTRRELIEPADQGYRFQVELIRRWFARNQFGHNLA